MQQNNNGPLFLPRAVRFIIFPPLFFGGGGIQYYGVSFTEATLVAPVTPQRMDNLVGGGKRKKERREKLFLSFLPPFFSSSGDQNPRGGKGPFFAPLSSLPLPPRLRRGNMTAGGEGEKKAVRKGGGGDISKVLKVWGRRSASGWGRP